MNHLFWRHAEAGYGAHDLARPLTPRGQAQAARTAQWLQAQGVAFPVFCSEALRGQQTAACYQTPDIVAGLNPDQGLKPVWEALDTLPDNAVIVGHMPWIAAAIARFIDQMPAFVGYSELFWLCNDDGTWHLKAHFAGG